MQPERASVCPHELIRLSTCTATPEQNRQELVRPGDTADCIFLIAHGELEILSVAKSDATSGPLSEPLISGLDLAQEAGDAADVWDNMHVADVSNEPGGACARGVRVCCKLGGSAVTEVRDDVMSCRAARFA